MFALGAYFGGNEKKYFGVQTRPGGWGGSSDHQNKTAPEPPAAPEPLVLQNKTAPEPPLPYFGGSTSKKNCARTAITYTTALINSIRETQSEGM